MDLKDKQQKKQTSKNKTFFSSLYYALQGFKTVFEEERNMKKHLLFASLALIMGYFFQLSKEEWLWLLLAIFLVLVMEIINTSFENVVDLVTKGEYKPLAKKVKDMAAAAVLFTSLFAILVGSFLFLPKIITWIEMLKF